VRGSILLLPIAVGLAVTLAGCDKLNEQLGHRTRQRDCVSCHLPEYQSARGHAGERPTTCAVCHASDAWHPTGLYHEWPLVGAHEKAKCFDCHMGDSPIFKGTPKACARCHQSDFDDAQDHVGQFPLTCEDCHTTTAWRHLVPRPKWPGSGRRDSK
jgi:hypothetical protein